MWKVDKPVHSPADTFAACISRIRNPNLLARMVGISDAVTEAAEGYDEAAEQAELYLIATEVDVDGEVTVDEMVKLYTGRMVPKDSPGRAIYDSIMSLAKHGRCPFCGHRVVSTLDHVLAKTQHPALTVTPNNLVPSCSDCNKAKLDGAYAVASDQYLHPYFDAIEDDLWLNAEVLQSAPASVRFYVDPHVGWTQLTADRVENHFQRLGLGKLYASQAAEELVNIRFQVASLFASVGWEGVRGFLSETHASRSQARTNSWQTAFYAALTGSDWYCQGGFA